MENVGPAFEANVPTRESLLRRVCNWNDDASWQEFFNVYWKIIYQLAVRRGLTEGEAEEVVQATMIAVMKKIRRFRYDPQTGSFRRWIANHANWKISDHVRRRLREQEHLYASPTRAEATHTGTGTVGRIPDRHNAFDQLVQEDWEQAVARMALARLKERVKAKHFQMFDLYVVKKWPMRQITGFLQVNAAHVYLVTGRVSRLLKKTTKEVESQLEHLPSTQKKKHRP